MGNKRMEYGETPTNSTPPKLQRAAPTEALTGIVIDKQHQHCQNPTDTNPYVFVGECVFVCEIISLDVPLRRGIIMKPRKTPIYEHVPPPDLPSVRSQGVHPSQGHTYSGTGARRQMTPKEPEPPPITGRTSRPRTKQTRDSR